MAGWREKEGGFLPVGGEVLSYISSAGGCLSVQRAFALLSIAFWR